jgi:hypothetical protein
LSGVEGATEVSPGPNALARHGLVPDRVAHGQRPSKLSKGVAVLVQQGIDRLSVAGGVAASLAGRDLVMGILPLDEANGRGCARTLDISRPGRVVNRPEGVPDQPAQATRPFAGPKDRPGFAANYGLMSVPGPR